MNKEKASVKLIDKAQRMWDNGLVTITPLPTPDEFGMVKMPYQELRRLMDERRKLSWADGVFHAFAVMP
jgi:hypothetical protein